MGFTIEVGNEANVGSDTASFSTGQDASHYLYYISKTLPASIGVSLTDMEALVKMEVTNTRYKFATFSISGAGWSIDNIEGSWHNAGSTAKQLISVSSGSLGISTGNYVGIVFEVPANTSQNTFIYTKNGGSSLTNYYQISGTYITSGTATSMSNPPLDIYGYGEYTHSNTDPIPQTSQSTGALSVDEVYTGYGAIRLTDIDCVGTFSALFEMQSPWGSTDNTVVLENGESETLSRSITGGTEYYTVTVTNINCVANTVTFTETWWSDVGKRYVKTAGDDSALGTTWDVAWLTMGYGFQNIPSSKDLYVEEGLYGGETLSNLNPPQTMNMYIQPSGHTEAACNVFVSDDTVFTDGYVSGILNNNSHYGQTLIDPNSLITQNGRLIAFSYYAPSSANQVKFKIFRSDGTNYTLVGESVLYTFSGSGWKYFNKCSIDVQINDILAVYTAGTTPSIGRIAGSVKYKYKVGDISGTTTIVSWTDWLYDHQIAMQAHGFY